MSLEELKKIGWTEIKKQLPPEVLDLLDAARRCMAIEVVNEKAAEVGAGKISASIVSAKIDSAVEHEKGKEAAKSIEDLIRESQERQEKLRNSK